MTSKMFILFLILLGGLLSSAQIPNNYYNSASGLKGEQLKSALHDIIKGHTEYPYTSSSTDTWDILKESDSDTSNTDNVILIYSGWSVNAAQEYNNGNGWTREHTWAKSHGGFDTDEGVGTDLHNLKPCDNTVNSARSNKDFDNGGSQYIDGDGPTDCYSDSDSWEPRDAVKGDVARILFYMATRYEGDDGEIDLELVDAVNTANTYGLNMGYHGKLSTLLQWHNEDPVDSFEIHRNDVIYSYQGNRNPFIDHPEYVDKIWALTNTNEFITTNPIKFYPNPTSDFFIIESSSSDRIEGEIFNLSGQLVLQFKAKGQRKIKLSKLKKGRYIIRFEHDNHIYSDTLIILK